MPVEGESGKPTSSPFFCYAVSIGPEQGRERALAARLEELLSRTKWLVRMRWIAVAGLAVATTVARHLLGLPVPARALYWIAGVLAAYNAAFYLFTRRGRRLPGTARQLTIAQAVAVAQIVMDLAALTVMLHYTGGVENPFFFYFVFHMIIASILLSRPASFYIASLGIGLFFALVLGEYRGVLAHHALWREPLGLYRDDVFVPAALTVFVTTMYMSVYFAADVVERLRARERELISVSTSLEIGTLELQQAYERIRTLEEKKSGFLRTAAHELRSPLSAMRSLLDVVLDGFAKGGAHERELLERAHNRVNQMLALVNDILALSRLKEAPEVHDAAAARTDACAILSELEALYRPKAEQKKVRLEILPPPAACAAAAASDDVRQVLTNLLDNAINYTGEGGTVTLSAEPRGASIVLAVKDTGIGVAPEDSEKVFDEFYRAPNAKAAHSFGTGLGLAIVKRTVENCKGTIRMESALGKGTTFTVVLPQYPPEA